MTENTTLMFLADHGDMLGEHGLWYKMSFREWSCRIPLIVHNPEKFKAARVTQPVAQVDVLPTLLSLAQEATGNAIPEPIDPLQGRTLLPLCKGNNPDPGHLTVSEYLAEGTGSPMLMLRSMGASGNYKYICCDTDPEQLFDLTADPDELVNLASLPEHGAVLEHFHQQALAHWDSSVLREKVVTDQRKRRKVSAALRIGRYKSWDYHPERNASEEYTRSHMDLTRFDYSSRYPRPAPFNPRWK